MRLLILGSLLFCAACEPPPTRYVRATIPPELLAPVPDPAPRVPTTTKALAAGYIARGAALTDANSRIEAVAEILNQEK